VELRRVVGHEPLRESPGTGVFNTTALARFMIASASLTDHGTNANDQLAAETMAMLKEQITETYGEIRYHGRQLGRVDPAIQHRRGVSRPLNGIQPNCTFPDTLTTAIEVAECGMLQANYYTTAPGNTLRPRNAAPSTVTTRPITAPPGTRRFPTGNPTTPAIAGLAGRAHLQPHQPAAGHSAARCSITTWGCSARSWIPTATPKRTILSTTSASSTD
jgi:hypothetical protein